MAPIAATWGKPLKAGSAPDHVDPHLPDGDGLLDPSGDPGVLHHGNLDTIPIDGVLGLCHVFCEC